MGFSVREMNEGDETGRVEGGIHRLNMKCINFTLSKHGQTIVPIGHCNVYMLC